MSTERKHFAVITNENYQVKEVEHKNHSNPIGYSSNPMYEKLLNYKQTQEKKRFTVDDLLKWC